MQIKSYGLRLIIGIVGPGVTILILQKLPILTLICIGLYMG